MLLTLAAALIVVVAIACSPTYLPDEAPPGTNDAGQDANTADVATPDSAAPGANDAAADAGDGSTRFCSSIGSQQNTDIFCADFDGVDFREGFTATTGDGGLKTTTATAVSAPNALLAEGPFGDTFQDRGPSLSWDKLGPSPISVIDVAVSINQPAPIGPPGSGNTGRAEVLSFKTELTKTELHYSREAPNWSVFITYNGGGAYAKSEPVPISLVEGKWTRVNLVYNIKTGNVSLLYDGVSIMSEGLYNSQPTLADSKATVTIGAITYGKTYFEPFRFDNLVARVTRQ